MELFKNKKPSILRGFIPLLTDEDIWFRTKSLEAHRRWARTPGDLAPLMDNEQRLVGELLSKIDAPELAIELLENPDSVTRSFAAKSLSSKEELHKAFHNLGNTYMQEENYQGAVDNFKKALLNNPDDEETRYNYVLAKELLKNQNNNKDKKDNKDNKDNKDKEKNKDQNQDKKDKDQEKQDKKDDKSKSENKPSKQDISPQQRKNILEAMSKEEKKVQEKINKKKFKGNPKSNKKDR